MVSISEPVYSEAKYGLHKDDLPGQVSIVFNAFQKLICMLLVYAAQEPKAIIHMNDSVTQA
jgi:hypothetical protein